MFFSLLLALACQDAPETLEQKGMRQLATAEAEVAAGKLQGYEAVDAFFEAARTLRQATEKGKASAMAWHAWSRSLVLCDDLRKGLQIAQDGLQVFPQDLDLALQIGSIRLLQADQGGKAETVQRLRELAAEQFAATAKAHPKRAEPWVHLGQAQIWLELPKDAESSWRHALKVDATAVDLGSLTPWLGGTVAALLIQEHLARNGEDALTLWYLATAEFAAIPRPWKSCRSHFQKVLELEPSYDSAWSYLANGSFAEASRLQERGEAAAARKEFLASAKAWGTYLSGRGGSVHLQVVRGAGGEAAIANLDWLAGTAWSRGDRKTAVSLVAWLVQARPQDPKLWNNYALFLRDTRAPEKSLQAYRRALALQPDDPQVMNDLAVILHYYLRRDDAEAIALYEGAIERAQFLLQEGQDEDGDLGPEHSRISTALRDARNNLRKLQAGNRRIR